MWVSVPLPERLDVSTLSSLGQGLRFIRAGGSMYLHMNKVLWDWVQVIHTRDMSEDDPKDITSGNTITLLLSSAHFETRELIWNSDSGKLLAINGWPPGIKKTTSSPEESEEDVIPDYN